MSNIPKVTKPEIKVKDMNSRPVAVIFIFVLDLIFLGAVIYVYHIQAPIELRTLLCACLSGWNGALALALNSKSTPWPIEDTSESNRLVIKEQPQIRRIEDE
jgi:hypothetical protein